MSILAAMGQHPFVIGDTERFSVFPALPAAVRKLRAAVPYFDSEGVPWLAAHIGRFALGLTPVGPSWIWDDEARELRASEYERCRQETLDASPECLSQLVRRALSQIQVGAIAERLLFSMHRLTLAQRCSVLQVADRWLSRQLWGNRHLPRHWRGQIVKSLKGLAWLHLTDWPDEGMPEFGRASALIAHVGDLRGCEGDACGPNCLLSGERGHHHLQVEIGPAFLGVLERFASLDSDGIRKYEFPVDVAKKSTRAALRKLGKDNRLASAFLPAKLGSPQRCSELTPPQHRLLQAIIRELTRAPRAERKSSYDAMAVNNAMVPDFAARKLAECDELEPEVAYVGFNGNGVRKGGGYRLRTPGGWLAKAGYAENDLEAFLSDADALAVRLGLVVVALAKTGIWHSLDRMRSLALTSSGRQVLDKVHVRIYSESNFLDRWCRFFEWENTSPAAARPVLIDQVATLHSSLRAQGLSTNELARGIGLSQSYVSRLITGKKPWPKEALGRAIDFVKAHGSRRGAKSSGQTKAAKSHDGTLLDEAMRCLDRNWSVVPQLPGSKKPCIGWKEYQNRVPTEEETGEWFRKWPNAGLALVLGPVSETLVIDVDGQEAHEALLERLGSEPVAVKAISGSCEPYRYHLFFQHPKLVTKSKQTPWHPKLEFRGHGGIVIIPPSLHKSGNRYTWAAGQSPDDMSVPPLPDEIIEALRPAQILRRTAASPKRVSQAIRDLDAAESTVEFLSGRYSEGPRWNERLFRAACDLAAREVSLEMAEPLLLQGAQPWSRGEEETARATICSAYSQPREPSRC